MAGPWLADLARWRIVDPGGQKLQLAGEAAAGGPGNSPRNPEFQRREIKPQTTD